MSADAAAAGVRLGITTSYRGYDQQVDLVRRKGLYSQGGLAAEPGTSNHSWGLSLDLDLDDRAQSWMRANAGRYGFIEDTPREPWPGPTTTRVDDVSVGNGRDESDAWPQRALVHVTDFAADGSACAGRGRRGDVPAGR